MEFIRLKLKKRINNCGKLIDSIMHGSLASSNPNVREKNGIKLVHKFIFIHRDPCNFSTVSHTDFDLLVLDLVYVIVCISHENWCVLAGALLAHTSEVLAFDCV